MRLTVKRLELGRRRVGVAVVAMATGSVGGCASPPSVMPLLEASQAVVAREAQRVRDDAALDAAQAEAVRGALSEAYAADLDARAASGEPLDPEWVREATAVLVEARGAMTRHEAARLAERERRAADLEAAAAAQAQAVRLLEGRDRLFRGPEGWDGWRLIQGGEAGAGR